MQAPASTESEAKPFRLEIIEARHDVSHFDCGNANLNVFLQHRALAETRHDLSRTYLLVAPKEPTDRRVAGYFALQADSKTLHHPVRDCETSLAFVELTFLARDSRWSGQGIGSLLLIESLRIAAETADLVGVSGLHLQPTREGARLYRNFGFEAASELPGRFWMPMAQIRRLLNEEGATEPAPE